MNSLDTNILLYGTNSDCAEHAWARPLVERLVREADHWMLADQVLLEYYRLLRNPAVLAKPLGAAEALARVEFFRSVAGCLHCGYELSCWKDMQPWLGRDGFPARRTFDLMLAATLRANGVRTFYTRNARDFRDLAFFEVIDPVPSSGSLYPP